MSTTNKLIRDGKIAVLISPGFGSGWSTQCTDESDVYLALFSPILVEAKEKGVKLEQARALVQKLGLSLYVTQHSWDKLEIVWLEPGTRFVVIEFDGSEEIMTQKDLVLTA